MARHDGRSFDDQQLPADAAGARRRRRGRRRRLVRLHDLQRQGDRGPKARRRRWTSRRQALADTKERLQQAEAEVAAKAGRARSARMPRSRSSTPASRSSRRRIGYLKVDHRVARFTAVDQTKDEATGEVSTLIEFVELNDEGHPIDTPRQFRDSRRHGLYRRLGRASSRTSTSSRPTWSGARRCCSSSASSAAARSPTTAIRSTKSARPRGPMPAAAR